MLKRCILHSISGEEAGTLNIRPWFITSSMYYILEEINVTHGMIIVPEIRCINNVELDYTFSASRVLVSYEKPVTTYARLFVVPNDMVTGTAPQPNAVVSNPDLLQFGWEGFSDISGVHHYIYRVLEGEHIIVNDTNTGSSSFASLANLDLKDGMNYSI